jgi:hypothetical protein
MTLVKSWPQEVRESLHKLVVSLHCVGGSLAPAVVVVYPSPTFIGRAFFIGL